ncbi:MAG: type II toxin-antitoxin system HicB family antitoxin [Clostridiales Family XIII bacterium]|jgi:predicted HicB family RNase H-like nuclease|nr:type II toxin-antitoxin system HicB family antitoxin [Clostridiales Family XIII bacterium]
MSNYIHYKNYYANIEFSERDEVFHGKVLGIRDLISFEGDNVKSLIQDFHEAVDEYLSFCESQGKEPEKPFKGSFNIRIGEELHRTAALEAAARGISLNALVEVALRQTIKIQNGLSDLEGVGV